MDEKDIIAKNITYYRKKCGLSQLELAEKLQYSNKNISKWEKGETVPSIFTLKRLAEIFGTTVDRLISEDDEQAVENSAPTDESEQSQTVKKRTPLGKILWLLLTNAIVIAGVCIAIYVLSLVGVTAFNKWLLLLYIPPLSALSVFVFFACVKKRFEIISISLFGWLTVLSVYITMPSVDGIEFIFFLMFGLQVLELALMLVINNHLKNNKNKKE